MLPFESHLEVRKRLPATPSRKPPLLFVSKLLAHHNRAQYPFYALRSGRLRETIT